MPSTTEFPKALPCGRDAAAAIASDMGPSDCASRRYPG